MRYLVVEASDGDGNPEAARYSVAALIEDSAPLGLRAAHYRLLHQQPLSWDQAESVVIALNRGDVERARQLLNPS